MYVCMYKILAKWICHNHLPKFNIFIYIYIYIYIVKLEGNSNLVKLS